MHRGFSRRRPSPATVISLIALFVALSGSAYAALSKNSVRSKQVKNGSLVSKDLKDGKGVTGADVAAGSLTGDDIDESALGTVPVANHATSADQLGGVPAGSYSPTQWAFIDADGTVVRQSGGISEVNGGNASFYVSFGSDVSDAAVQVTPVSQTFDDGYGVSAVVAPCADIDCGPELDDSYVFVRTSNGSGTVNNQAFYITVTR
jgi:hypothetical protein